MKIKKYFLLSLLVVLLTSCREGIDDRHNDTTSFSYCLPRVLILTTGLDQGNGTVAEGVVVANHFFNRNGAIVTLDNRDVLLNEDKLKNYNIIIALTATGYHDADRRYSLTYLSEEELKSLRHWIDDGGFLVAGDNFGRNLTDGTDRTSLYGTLTPQNWPLGDCFGVSLIEKDLIGFGLEGTITKELSGVFIEQYRESVWALVPDSVYDNKVSVLASWINGQEIIPALIRHPFGKGMTYLLPTSYLLHPANVGGVWGITQIEQFYALLLKNFSDHKKLSFTLNIWPEACEAAFCVSLNSEGNSAQYNRLLKLLENEKIVPTFFVDGETDSTVIKLLQTYPIQSNGLTKFNSRLAPYYEMNRSIVSNELFWKRHFKGFRFPFTMPAYEGFEILSARGYLYDSSIGVDNIQHIYGCLFPYNLQVAKDGLYKNTGMLEISPILNDDYYFFSKILTPHYSENEIEKDIQRYRQYLDNCWKFAISPNHGVMVWQGHPAYSGYSDSTLIPLKTLIATIKKENVWISNLDSLQLYWRNLEQLKVEVREYDDHADISMQLPRGIVINNLTLQSRKPVKSVEALKGNCRLLKRDGKQYIIMDAFNGQQIIVKY